MLIIDKLKNNPSLVPYVSNIWWKEIGKIYYPELSIKQIIDITLDEFESDEATSYVACENNNPVGLCTFSKFEELKPDLGPWISDLVIEKKYQNKGIGKALHNEVLGNVREQGYEKVYLFAFSASIVEYYKKLGWSEFEVSEHNKHKVMIMMKSL